MSSQGFRLLVCLQGWRWTPKQQKKHLCCFLVMFISCEQCILRFWLILVILSWVAEPYHNSNWVYFTSSGQMFVFLPQFCIVCDRCVQRMSANKQSKQNQAEAWTEVTEVLCSRSVEMKPSAWSLYTTFMLRCVHHLLGAEAWTVSVQSAAWSVALIFLIPSLNFLYVHC